MCVFQWFQKKKELNTIIICVSLSLTSTSMIFGLISHGWCRQEANHKMFVFFNFFFVPLYDITLYKTPCFFCIYCFWPNSMHMVPSEHKTQFLNPSQWDPWEFFNKKNCPGSFLLQKGIPLDQCEIVPFLRGTANQWVLELSSQFLIIQSRSCNLTLSATE